MRLIRNGLILLGTLAVLAIMLVIILGDAIDRDRDRSLGSSVSTVDPTPTVTRLDPNTALTRGVVERVSDGDTVRVRIGNTVETVRLVGIDAPELNGDAAADCLAEDARDYLTRLVNGKTVYLERDVSDRDQYGRLLRYLWLPKDEGHLLVNQMIVGRGLAVARIYGDDDWYADRLAAAELDALRQQRGLWGECVTAEYRGVAGAPAHWNGRGDLDCGDFSTRANAQAFYAAQGGPRSDPHNLDIDRDGRVCVGRRPSEPSG
ncbi:MAG: thermonuclease family protein [Thermomicrobiales bacterium]|nr:thermonuclease family protein [Thermomicrobiales bacterium]